MPAPPQGVGTDRLVPTQAPTSAVICRYETRPDHEPRVHETAYDGRLAEVMRLQGELTTLADDLSLLPIDVGPPGDRGCGVDRATPYLLGLTYPGGGAVWVHAEAHPQACTGATNGVFRTSAYLGDRMERAFTQRGWWRWFALGFCGSQWTPGRLSQESTMIPGGVAGVEVCDQDGKPGYVDEPIIAAINALPTRPASATVTCATPSGKPARGYTLYVYYNRGPGLRLSVETPCDPEVRGGSLSASDPNHTILALLDKAYGR